MQLNIPSTPNYLSFLTYAENIDDLGEWLDGATITGTYSFQSSPDIDPVILTDSEQVGFIIPDLAAKGESDTSPQPYKLLRTADNKFLCQKEE